MTKIVPADEIETIVGVQRHSTEHWGRAVSSEQTVYILHSQECRDSGIDLRECPYSLALDNGIDPFDWTEDVALRLWLDEQDDKTWLVPDANGDAQGVDDGPSSPAVVAQSAPTPTRPCGCVAELVLDTCPIHGLPMYRDAQNASCPSGDTDCTADCGQCKGGQS